MASRPKLLIPLVETIATHAFTDTSLCVDAAQDEAMGRGGFGGVFRRLTESFVERFLPASSPSREMGKHEIRVEKAHKGLQEED